MTRLRRTGGAGGPPVVLFAAVGGAAVASNYYVQPLLPAITREFGMRQGAAGLLVTVSQLGYLAGLVTLVPLGDLVDRRRLTLSLSVATIAALLAAAAAPGIAWLVAASALFGATTVLAQVLVALSADLSPASRRGANVGAVMTGILVGVLLARTAAGVIADLGGWRLVYVLAAALLAAMTALMWRRLPSESAPRHRGYVSLMASIVRLVWTEPILRIRAAYGALTFAAFSVLWATLALMLAGPPYSYGEGVIGAFGLAAAAGALAALFGGRWSDKGHVVRATGAGLAIGIIGFAFLAAGNRHLWALICGIVLVDFAGQLVQAAGQAKIYQLGHGIRSRVTTAYMGSRFAGGAVGSALGVAAYSTGGWAASSALGAGLYGAGLVLWLAESRFGRVDRDAVSGRPVKLGV